uniref:Protein kinase domain-containing protein n=1 Tax=Phytophthora ramorum TaxID=164328 RepID=H3GC06_PHYRM
MFVLIAGVVVVILLMYVLAWQWITYRKDRPSETLSRASSHDFYSIFNRDFEDHETMRVRLAADPIIVTNRLAYDEVKLGRCISRGGFGLVFTGTYRSRPVAIKKIRVNKDAEADQIEQFIREIALMAILRHPRIVEFIGVAWEAVVDLSAVTELMTRGDLSTVLRANQLTWGDHKATIALHIVEALAYLHSLNPKVIHRDLKSNNVLLNEEMEAKLIDFGISRERHGTETHMTAGMGTSFWIAPEVLRGQDYNEKADVFSFGVVLSELDTNDYPYWNATNPPGGKLQEGEILLLVAAGQMRPSFSTECPAPILGVASHCLQVRPEDRPSAAELLQVFQELLLVQSMSSNTRVSSLSMDRIGNGKE